MGTPTNRKPTFSYLPGAQLLGHISFMALTVLYSQIDHKHTGNPTLRLHERGNNNRSIQEQAISGRSVLRPKQQLLSCQDEIEIVSQRSGFVANYPIVDLHRPLDETKSMSGAWLTTSLGSSISFFENMVALF